MGQIKPPKWAKPSCQKQPAFPVTIPEAPVIDREAWNREAVMDTRIDLDRMVGVVLLQCSFKSVGYSRRDIGVDLGHADIDFATHFRDQQMRAIGCICRQTHHVNPS